MKKEEADVLPTLLGKRDKGLNQQPECESDKPAAVYAVGFSMLGDNADGVEAVFKRNGKFVFWCKSESQHQYLKHRVNPGVKLKGFFYQS